MSAAKKLHHLIEKMVNERDSESIPRGDLRDAAEIMGLFPVNRFRQAFYDALARLEANGVIERDGESIILLQTVGEAQDARRAELSCIRPAPSTDRPAPEEKAARDARFMALWTEMQPDNRPVRMTDLRAYCGKHGMRELDVFRAMVTTNNAGRWRVIRSGEVPEDTLVVRSDER